MADGRITTHSKCMTYGCASLVSLLKESGFSGFCVHGGHFSVSSMARKVPGAQLALNKGLIN